MGYVGVTAASEYIMALKVLWILNARGSKYMYVRYSTGNRDKLLTDLDDTVCIS